MDAGVTVYNYMDTFFCCKVEKDKWCEEMGVGTHVGLSVFRRIGLDSTR